MYNPDLRYKEQMRYLEELREQATHRHMVATLTAGQPTWASAAGRQLGALRATLGSWLAQPAQPGKQPACTCEC